MTRKVLFLAAGTTLGLWLRVGLNEVLPHLFLLVANLVGTLTLLFYSANGSKKFSAPEHHLFIATGFCGSLTTYSTSVTALLSTQTPSPPLDFTMSTIMGITLCGILGSTMRWLTTTHAIYRMENAWGTAGSRRSFIGKLLKTMTPQLARETSDARGAINRFYATIFVNLYACTLAACVLVLSRYYPFLSGILSIGFLSCYSTFSTAIVDVWNVWKCGYKLFALTTFVGVFLCAFLIVSAVTVVGNMLM